MGFAVGVAIGVLAYLARRTKCSCGHSREAHKHYRPGSDCSLCGCTQMGA